jgi:hypothetical protein
VTFGPDQPQRFLTGWLGPPPRDMPGPASGDLPAALAHWHRQAGRWDPPVMRQNRVPASRETDGDMLLAGVENQAVWLWGEPQTLEQRSPPASSRYLLEGRGRARRPTPLAERSSGRFPAPAIIVFADNCFAVTRHSGHTAVIIAAIFTRLVASSLITERVTTCWRCRSRRRGCCRRRRLNWHGWRGCLTSRTRLRNHMHQRGRDRGIHVIAGVIGDIANLGAVTGAERRSCNVPLDGRQALVGDVIPLPFAAELLCYRGFSWLGHPEINVAG